MLTVAEKNLNGPTMKALLTVGYEGMALDDFIALLRKARVTTLLDVRELPLSRRKGFSKRSLSDTLAAADIHYRHERDLGAPRQVRHQLRADGDLGRYFEAFDAYLQGQRLLLEELSRSLRGSVALMCFERDHAACHRSSVARELGKLTGLSTTHLGARNVSAFPRAGSHSGQGIPAA